LFDDFGLPTAADISGDGDEILVRSYSVGRLYTRPPGGSIADAINASPVTIPIASESQGEAIGFDPMGWGYYTTTEGSSAPVSYYNRLPPPAGTVYWDNDGVAAGSRLTTGTGLGGSGTWNATVRKWYNGSAEVPWVNGANAAFWGAAGTVTISGAHSVNSLLFKSTGYTLTSGTITLAGPSITVEAGATATINTPISGAEGLIKTGGGTLHFGAANTYTGATTVTAGILNVVNAAGSATGAGMVTIGAGAQLGGTGSIQGDVANSGIVAPGASIGALTIGGTYSQNAGGTLSIELAAASHDTLAVAGLATLGGTLVVTLGGGFTPQLNDGFDIITAAGFSGSGFADFILPPLPHDLAWGVEYGATAVSLSIVHSGDFNRDGIVDVADYIAWVKTDGTPEGYNAWRANFGRTTGAGVGASSVAEPYSVMAILAAIWGIPRRRR
jgi:autotransporter-associated beta strand protein